MMSAPKSRAPSENAEAIGLIVALLERFPEIASLASHPADGTLSLSFAVRKRLDKATQAGLRDLIVEHVSSFTEVLAEPLERLGVAGANDYARTLVGGMRDDRTVKR